MTYMWQLTRGENLYRFQTDEKHIRENMKRREKFKQVGRCLNPAAWIFQAEISRPDVAKNILETLTGGKIKKIDDCFCVENGNPEKCENEQNSQHGEKGGV